MIDYSQVVNDLQRELAQRAAEDPRLFNVPGVSLACRIDPWYFVGPHPGLVERMASWRSLRPVKVREALVRTGDLVTAPPERKVSLTLGLTWAAQRATMEVCFLHASFVDRALALYGRSEPPPVSPLRIAAEDRGRVEAFLAGKTMVESLAFQD